MKIAVAGPDGSGKTSVCKVLSQIITPSRVIYAGKNRNHILPTTTLGLGAWTWMSKYGFIWAYIGRFFIFYPLEYLENLIRFYRTDLNTLIYDRHPIDRVIMKHELSARFKSCKVRRLRMAVEYPQLVLWGFLYRVVFPTIDRLYVLIPDPQLCFERSSGEYSDLEAARIKVQAYNSAIAEYGTPHWVTTILVNQATTVEDVASVIINDVFTLGHQQ